MSDEGFEEGEVVVPLLCKVLLGSSLGEELDVAVQGGQAHAHTHTHTHTHTVSRCLSKSTHSQTRAQSSPARSWSAMSLWRRASSAH